MTAREDEAATPGQGGELTGGYRPRLRRRPPAPPRSAPGRLLRRVLLVVALCAVAFLFQRNAFQQFTDRLFGPPIDWHNDYAMSNRLYDMIVSHRLTDVSRPCLLLNIHGGDPAQATALDVYERPTEACMGPAHGKVRMLPRLFGLRVDRDAGHVQTDAGTPGTFHAL